MSADVELVLLFAGMHLFGLILAGVMCVVFLRSDTEGSRHGSDEDDGGGGGSDRERPRAPQDPGGGGLPLPDAAPSRVRLREPGRLADAMPDHPRRPAHRPAPSRPRAPVGR